MSDFSHLSALFLNCSLEYDPADSHTARLMSRSAGIMGTEGVSVETVHALEHVIPHGMYPDLTEHGRPRDDWPEIQAKIRWRPNCGVKAGCVGSLGEGG